MKKDKLRGAARYFLAASGIIIGIALVTLVLGIAEGGEAILNEGYWSKGIRIYEIKGENYLRREDGRLIIDKMLEAKGSIPVLKVEARLKSYKAAGTAETLAVNEKYMEYANLKLIRGSFFNEQDITKANKSAVIDNLTALKLYGTADAIGQTLKLEVAGKEAEFTIIGVVRNFNRNIETLFEEDLPGLCLIPNTVPEDASWAYRVQKLIALVDKELHEEEAASMLSHLLEREHYVEGVFSVEEYDQLPEAKALKEKYLAFSVIAAVICLLLGSVTVMNATLLTIQEKKQEIGLYILFGSGVKDLQYGLVYRIVLICLGAGLSGMVLGALAGNGIGYFINISTRFSLLTIFITAAASGFTGLISSLYPAGRMAKVDVSEVIWGDN
jgi:putative ABC transport system permease protein